jgi:hypothetical protein
VEYGRKVKDLIKADGQLSIDRLSLLRIGRHFRLSANYKGIVGRNHRENQALFRYFYQHRRAEGFYLFSALGAPGPLTLGLGQPGAGDLENVARLTIRYSDHPQETVVTVKILVSGRAHHLTTLSIPPAPKESPFDGNRFRIT